MSVHKSWKLLPFSQVNSQLYTMKGKLLTLIDALIPDNSQNKATKDLIHDIVGTTQNLFWRHAIGDKVFPPTPEEIATEKLKLKSSS